MENSAGSDFINQEAMIAMSGVVEKEMLRMTRRLSVRLGPHS